MDVEPGPTRTRAGQVVTRTHQRLINVAIDSLQEDDCSGLPDFETDDNDQESLNVIPQFEVQDDSRLPASVEFISKASALRYKMMA